MYFFKNLIKNNYLHIELAADGSFKPRWYKADPARTICNFHFLQGAGYRNGFTFYFALNLNHPESRKRKLIQFGLTSDANYLPYLD